MCPCPMAKFKHRRRVPPLPKDIRMSSRAMEIQAIVIRLVIDKHPIIGYARHMALSLAYEWAGKRMVFVEFRCRDIGG